MNAYKYSLKRHMSQYSRAARARMRDRLTQAWGVSASRYYQIINAREGSTVSMTDAQIVLTTKILGCTALSLFAHKDTATADT